MFASNLTEFLSFFLFPSLLSFLPLEFTEPKYKRSCDSGSNGIHVDRNCALQCWSLIFHPQCCNLSIATIVACMLTCPNVAYCTYIFPLLLSTLMQINNKKTQTHKSLDFLVRTYSLFILFSHFLPVRYPDSCRQEKHS